MQIGDLNSGGALPALEMTLRYAAQRQRLLAHNIANADTPNFVARDVKPEQFQKVLSEAVDRRRDKTAGAFGALDWREGGGLAKDRDGNLRLNPTTPHGGVLRHDRNATDMERLMQDMVENASVARAVGDLMKKQKSSILSAISQQIR